MTDHAADRNETLNEDLSAATDYPAHASMPAEPATVSQADDQPEATDTTPVPDDMPDEQPAAPMSADPDNGAETAAAPVVAAPAEHGSPQSSPSVASQPEALQPETAQTAQTEAAQTEAPAATAVGFLPFGLEAVLLQAVAKLGFDHPTPVQALSLPAGVAGKDLMVSSQTGSGKTLAFLIPAVQRLLLQVERNAKIGRFDRMVAQPQILVLCPTRELSQQVAQDAINLVRPIRGIRVASVTGGVPFARQLQNLRGANLVVATPGRLLDLAGNGQIGLENVSVLVLDEADRMLDLGFQEDLENIHGRTAARQQTLMFSATFAGAVEKLAATMMNDPQRLDSAGGDTTNADIEQTLHWTDGYEHKFKLLEHWLTRDDLEQAVVFASTQQDTDDLANQLSDAGHSVVALHGAMPQGVRNQRIRSLRSGQARILVATDVAARGLDVPGITHVINFGLPMKNEDYVHRIGRTGRAGRKGRAITLATQRERRKIRSLEDYLTQDLTVTEITGLEPRPFTPSGPRKPGRSYNDRGGRARSGDDRSAGRYDSRGDRGGYAPRRDDRRSTGAAGTGAGYRGREGYGNRTTAAPSGDEGHQPAYNRNQFSWEREGQSPDRRREQPGSRSPRPEGGYRGDAPRTGGYRSEGSRAPARDGSRSAYPGSNAGQGQQAGRPAGDRQGGHARRQDSAGGGARPYRNDDAYFNAFESKPADGNRPAPRRLDRREQERSASRRSFGPDSGRAVFRQRDDE